MLVRGSVRGTGEPLFISTGVKNYVEDLGLDCGEQCRAWVSELWKGTCSGDVSRQSGWKQKQTENCTGRERAAGWEVSPGNSPTAAG